MTGHKIAKLMIVVLIAAWPPSALAGNLEELPDSQAIMQAMTDEITRSLDLQMEDLEKPYFLQFTVDDVINFEMSAAYGTITSFNRDRSRRFFTATRVGDFDLDNTNFIDTSGFGRFGGFGGGSQSSLPLDEDYTALRQAMWRAADRDYKQAVETLTKKRTYLENKTIKDRPPDFTKAPVVEHIDPPARLAFDAAQWKERLREISGHFKQYAQLQDTNVQLLAGAGNYYVVNTEGTRLRIADSGALLLVTAEIQAEDGMRISGGLDYFGETLDALPTRAAIEADIDDLVAKLTQASEAPVLESYTGPVLFDATAAGQVFRGMLSQGVAGNPDPIGSGRRMTPATENLEQKLGQRILPRSFAVYDDPTQPRMGETLLLGHYRYDAEGVAADRVNIVTAGKLENLALSRVPTKKLAGSNGHGRRPMGRGDVKAAIACLFIEDENGIGDDELKAALIEAAREEGLEYGIRVTSLRSPGLGSSQADAMSFFMAMRRGGPKDLDDPVFAYKVYVDDGREELVRGCEFGQVKLRDLRDILAAGNEPEVYNYIGIGLAGLTPPTSIISPAILFEELELQKIEQELDKLPILTSPLGR